MKILLMRPPFARLKGLGHSPAFPLGNGSIAATLEQKGFEVRVYHPDNLRTKETPLFTDDKIIFKLRSKSYKRYISALNNDKHPMWQEISLALQEYQPDIVGITVLTPEVGSALKVSSLCRAYKKDCKVVWGGVHPTFLAEDCLQNQEIDFVVRGEGEYTMLELCE